MFSNTNSNICHSTPAVSDVHSLAFSLSAFIVTLFLSGLGEFMAQKEAKAMIALILQRFRLEHDPTNKVEGYFGIAMPAINGIKMTVHRR